MRAAHRRRRRVLRAEGDLEAKQRFLAGPFREWLDLVPADEVVLVAGNHDQSIEAWGVPDGLRCHYLEDEMLELFGLTIWGTPCHPWFNDWAFNAPQVEGETFLAFEARANSGRDRCRRLSRPPTATAIATGRHGGLMSAPPH